MKNANKYDNCQIADSKKGAEAPFLSSKLINQ